MPRPKHKIKPGLAAPTAPVKLAGARRKNLWISQPKLDSARKELGVATETEAIDRALDLVVFQREARSGLAAMAGKGGFTNYFDK